MKRTVIGLFAAMAVLSLATAGTGVGVAQAEELHCFSNPSICGYPDTDTSGLSNPEALESSGSITVTTPGTVIANKDVTGTIVVNANNVTIENTRVTQTSTCGPTNSCGNYAIGVNVGLTGVKIKHVETRTEAGKTCAQDIRTGGNGLVIEDSYLHACDGNIFAAAPTTLKDSYGVAKIDISADHIENVYFTNTTFTAIHDTLLNPVGQTAVIFGNVNGGAGGTCTNDLVVEDSLVAGGGYLFYPCGNGTLAGSSSRTIVGNHIARCLTTEKLEGGHHLCSEGPDSNGYFPRGGSYGLLAYDPGGVWEANVWDDNGAEVTP
jgi:hypothetical protein